MEVQNADAYFDGRPGRTYQSGYHSPVICEACNKLTGARYGTEFAKWSEWGHVLLAEGRKKEPARIEGFRGCPLRIAKQIVATMLAASQEELISQRPDLRDFVVDPELAARPGQIRLATYLCGTRSGRTTGLAVAMKPNAVAHWLVEFALPSFGYVLTVSGEPFDPRPCDIGWFTTCSFNEERDVAVPRLHVLPTHEAFPGDYRTKNEIRRDMIVN
ncbi:MAG: hypothetical protein ABI910_19945, partial [Gemmatimonadota bacterium]